MFLKDGKVDDEASKTGPLAVATPGALAGYAMALEKFGRRKLPDLLSTAAKLAEEGFAIDEVYARKSTGTADRLKLFDSSRQILLHGDGSALQKGDILKQPELAATLRAIATHGVDWIYKGEFAEKVDAWMRANGGVLRKEDFAAYAPKLRDPLRTRYRGYDIIGLPPPSSGGVHVAEILNMLETFDVPHLGLVDRTHVMAESMKLAFADRAFWLGDPDFVPVPRGLIDPAYGKSLAARIDLKKTISVPSHGDPPNAKTEVFGDFGKHTTHLSAADADGNWVAITQTINTAFGSKVIVPGTGVILNDEMDDFAVAPGVPNAFKLVGAEANAVAPLKRPLSSMSPTIVLKDGKPILSVGAAGGPTIITQTLQAIVGVLDLNLDIAAALARPRIHQQWSPDQLKIEEAFGEDVLKELQARGHHLDRQKRFGACQGVMWDASSQSFQAAHDPRVPGEAGGW
jgi:gamma-glutamyltranspeptidase/glutathione hydrolase